MLRLANHSPACRQGCDRLLGQRSMRKVDWLLCSNSKRAIKMANYELEPRTFKKCPGSGPCHGHPKIRYGPELCKNSSLISNRYGAGAEFQLKTGPAGGGECAGPVYQKQRGRSHSMKMRRLPASTRPTCW